jgi:ATP phosphoribosyltransferase
MRIAIPKGRLQDRALGVFAAAGFAVPDEADLKSRKLVFRGGDVGARRSAPGTSTGAAGALPYAPAIGDVEWIFVKDCDVPVYVEHGAADAGIAGLDQILEHECTAYQPVEFEFGRCRMMLIAGPGAPPLTKIATKYPRMARQYLNSRGLRAEIVPLGGSVELAAVLALTSHAIDLVESGETVRVHKLEMQDLVAEISPRLIVGKNAYRTKVKEMRELIARIEQTRHAERSEAPGVAGGVQNDISAPPDRTAPSLTLGMTKERS